MSNYANKKLRAASFSAKRLAFSLKDPDIKLPPMSHVTVATGSKQWGLLEMDRHALRLIDAALARWPAELSG